MIAALPLRIVASVAVLLVAGLVSASDEPIHCSVICAKSTHYECCYARCVCTTDPDPEVRRDHCADVPRLCRIPQS